LQLLVFIAQRLDGTRPTREFRAGQNGSNQPFSHENMLRTKMFCLEGDDDFLWRPYECIQGK
jgi:hypothetical protein